VKTNYEIERRFLVTDTEIIRGHTGDIIVQAYLFVADGYIVRVRRTHTPTRETGIYDEGPAIIAAKGPRDGPMREEYELEVPANYATELIRRAQWKISKVRYQIVDNERLWDIDVFHGANEGLIIAECEGHRTLDLVVPKWCGLEITDDRRFDNERLAQIPYSTWPIEAGE
jgi:CYTH domain-containing protein